MVEIERKFLVTSQDFKQEATTNFRIVQGFLSRHPERIVRVRIKGNEGYLTVKGISNEAGTIRIEWETSISLQDAEMLIALCEETIIEKQRFEVNVGEHTYEIDVFLGVNEGLIVAEIELKNEHESFEKPSWLGEEVTGQIEYYNSQLSINPFKNWK